MESSSDDSFLWTDASPESTNMEHDEESASHATFKHKVHHSHHGNHNDINNEIDHKKKSKKRNISETSNITHSDKKRIKLEPESDAEVRKKKKVGNNITDSSILQDNALNDDDYLNTRVKQEQASLIEPQVLKSKKKNKHSSISDIQNAKHSQSSVDLDDNDTEKYLDMRVKEEQESFVMPAAEKSKRKKKHKSLNSTVEDGSKSQIVEEPNSNDTETYLNLRVKEEQESVLKPDVKVKKKKKHKICSADSVTEDSESQSATIANNYSAGDEVTDMDSVIESKFSAEETVINKPKKKKHKRDDKSMVSSNVDKSAIDRENGTIEAISKDYSDENSDNDISVQPNDFNSNNIVSSTIINNSAIDIISSKHKQSSITEDLLGKEKNLHRTTKISDRIRFEDDDSSSQQDLNFNKPSFKVETFLKVNPHLQLFSPRTEYNSTITKDDEIWILRCPREINQKRLKSINLSLEGKCKLKIDGQTYDGIPNEDINRITHVAYRNGHTSIMNFPVKGCVHYRKRIPKAHIPEDMNMVNNQTNFIPLPETKCRHPLFGANYKKAIKIPAVVAARLEAAKDRHNETFEGTKKKKRKKDKKKSLDVKMEEECKTELVPPVKKNRKRKHSDVTPKKTKRLKHDPQSVEVWESEQAIEESLFNF